jgi:uracil-DNA glycosylase
MFNNNWDEVLKDEMNKEYFLNLQKFVNNERKTKIIFPKEEDVYNAFRLTDFNDIKVVILGQDPYHGEGEAMGLSFAVREGIKLPPSLRNIFKEYKSDLKIERTDTNLTDLALNGVFLLNTVLTVEKDNANSHKNKGWEFFTDFVIKKISDELENVVFILWGNQAKEKKNLIDIDKHYIIESAHPSPLSASRGFFESKPFSKTDNYLESVGKGKVFTK